MSEDDTPTPPPLPITSTPPSGELDNEYVRKTLHAIKVELAGQREIEAERAGAAKLRNRLIAGFGSLITAGALAGFGWVATVQSKTTTHEVQIERIEERAHDHDPPPNGHEDLDERIDSNRDRVQAVEHTTRGIGSRLDRMEREATTRHNEITAELRRLRNARRTWGGGD